MLTPVQLAGQAGAPAYIVVGPAPQGGQTEQQWQLGGGLQNLDLVNRQQYVLEADSNMANIPLGPVYVPPYHPASVQGVGLGPQGHNPRGPHGAACTVNPPGAAQPQQGSTVVQQLSSEETDNMEAKRLALQKLLDSVRNEEVNKGTHDAPMEVDAPKETEQVPWGESTPPPGSNVNDMEDSPGQNLHHGIRELQDPKENQAWVDGKLSRLPSSSVRLGVDYEFRSIIDKRAIELKGHATRDFKQNKLPFAMQSWGQVFPNTSNNQAANELNRELLNLFFGDVSTTAKPGTRKRYTRRWGLFHRVLFTKGIGHELQSADGFRFLATYAAALEDVNGACKFLEMVKNSLDLDDKTKIDKISQVLAHVMESGYAGLDTKDQEVLDAVAPLGTAWTT